GIESASRGFQEQAFARLRRRVGRVFHAERRDRGDDRGATLAGVDGDHASARKRSARTKALGQKVSGEFLESRVGHREESISPSGILRNLSAAAIAATGRSPRGQGLRI